MDKNNSQLKWIDSQKLSMLQTLQEWCAVNSGSDNSEGLSHMLELLSQRFASLGGTLSKVTLPPRLEFDEAGNAIETPSASALHITKRPEAATRFFLGGHMDTVYSKNHPFQTSTLLEGNILRGPGSADMKGGLVILLTALAAFEKDPNAQNIGWELVINPDEEIGSVASAPLLLECAGRTHAALIFEPSFKDGALVSSRKGSANWMAIARGKAAHAGRDFHKGCNAITALAEFIVEANRINLKEEKASH